MNIMDCLHDDNIEIVSPSFMNQRKLPDDMVVLPVKSKAHKEGRGGRQPEDLIFDKADEAEAKERTEVELLDQLAQVELALKTADGETKVRKQNEFSRYSGSRETTAERKNQRSDET